MGENGGCSHVVDVLSMKNPLHCVSEHVNHSQACLLYVQCVSFRKREQHECVCKP